MGKERSKAIQEPITLQIGGRRGQDGREKKGKKEPCVGGGNKENGRRGASIHILISLTRSQPVPPTGMKTARGCSRWRKTYLGKGFSPGMLERKNDAERLNLEGFFIKIFYLNKENANIE